ncbi:hypothetical protein AGABI1DRAFT_129113 [Agaricus bisporus var. burnettii JB137-S8]|uniref:J domain-containing protein n=1 Tax=Agaricus bisporus var. burnettii (strain JB137-S8 / ATCC MYA-4627 / FGSC 10392) TaxID=597362 RepID=K5XUQ0_AGABU|nr:uncharacterized protein AGABI1DRAFT_129113 [Agaricus bisporus var. burnettii JB137-S8]EKM78835.1 hypothetical protein AGABI1DRAFT_129113 [Agaricus bisporus var. burnettii JB137-S8]
MSSYDVLQVSSTATEEEIRMAYKTMAKQWHPDRKLDDQETATRKFKEINSAYRAILHERRRDAKRQSSSMPSPSKPSSSRETHNSASSSKSLPDNSRQSSNPKTIQSDNKTATTIVHSNKGYDENVEEPHKRHRSGVRKEEKDSLAKAAATPSSMSSYTSSPSSSSSIPLPSLSSFSSQASSSGSSTSSRSSSSSRTSSRKSGADFDTFSPTSSRTSVTTGSTDDLREHDVGGSKEQPPRVPGATTLLFTSFASSEVSTHEDDIPEITLSDVLGVELKHCDADIILPTTSISDEGSSSSTIPSEVERRQKPSKSSHTKDSSKAIKEDGERSDRTLIPEFDCPLARSVGLTKQWTYTIQLTLQQLFRGKKMRFKIVRCKLDGKRKSVTLDVTIPPGTLHGTQVIFKAAGHELKNGTRQDIVFIIEEAKHERFVRMKEDLALDVRLPWVESLKKEVGTVHVQSLDGKEYKFEVDFKTDADVTGTTVIPDAGMPIPKTKKRGDLIVRWEIYMPPAPSRWETFKQALHL